MFGILALSGVLVLLGDPPTSPAAGVDLPVALDGDGPALHAWARGEYWYADPTGQVVITRGSRPGTGGLLRVGEDFGLEPSGVPGAELGAALGDHRIRLSYLHLSFDGHEDLDEDLVFHGKTYTAGERVHATLDL